MNSIILNYNGKSYILEKIHDEHLDETYNRLWKIILHDPIDDIIYEKLITISKLWFYKCKFHCFYSPKIEQLIELF